MNVAIVCWRPFQIFNAIRIITSGLMDSENHYDLYAQDLSSILSIKENLVKTDLFNHVYIFEEKTQGHTPMIRIKRLKNYVFCKAALKDDDISGEVHSYSQYELILASGWASYFIELVNANPKASVYMFEDGASVFYGDERYNMKGSHSKLYRVMNTVFKKGPYSVKVEKLFVNNRLLASDRFPYPVIEIPKDTDVQMKYLKQVFGNIPIGDYKGKKVIYISQTRTEHSVPCYDDLKMCEPLRAISNKVIIRPHPKWPFHPEGFDVDNSGAMWELLVNELEDVILIGEHSTAMFTPQMLYGKNYTLIFLYKIMCKNQMMIQGLDDTISIFRRTNKNIFTPQSYDEYMNIISSVCK